MQTNSLRPTATHRLPGRLLAVAYCTIGDFDRAVEFCQEWVKAEPDDPMARHTLAACSQRDVPARASDRAGNEASTGLRLDGRPMVISLPIRIQAILRAGFVRHKRVRKVVGRRGHRRVVRR